MVRILMALLGDRKHPGLKLLRQTLLRKERGSPKLMELEIENTCEDSQACRVSVEPAQIRI